MCFFLFHSLLGFLPHTSRKFLILFSIFPIGSLLRTFDIGLEDNEKVYLSIVFDYDTLSGMFDSVIDSVKMSSGTTGPTIEPEDMSTQDSGAVTSHETEPTYDVKKLYVIVLKLWNICCKAYPSLPLYLTASPPVDRLAACILSNEKEDKHGLQLSVAFSHQSMMSLANLFWCGFKRASPKPSLPFQVDFLIDIQTTQWNSMLQKSRSHVDDDRSKFESGVHGGHVSLCHQFHENEDPEYDKMHIEGQGINISPLLLSMFMGKAFAGLKPAVCKNHTVRFNNGTRKKTFKLDESSTSLLPLQVAQPRCNHRSYSHFALSMKVCRIINDNFSNPTMDYWKSSTLYCLLYKENVTRLSKEKSRAMVEGNSLLIKPIIERLDTPELESAQTNIAAPITSNDLDDLAKSLGFVLPDVPNSFKVGYQFATECETSLTDAEFCRHAKFLRTTEEREKFFCDNAQVMWKFCSILERMNVCFNALSSTQEILNFRAVLAKKLGILDIDPPTNIPDLVEECRTLLHAVTPVRIGMIEGLGRMLSIYYHSRFMYPESSASDLIERNFQTKEKSDKHLLRKTAFHTKKNDPFSGYIHNISRKSCRVIFHIPVCLPNGDRHSQTEYLEEDMEYMRRLSKKHQNAASMVQKTSYVDLIKGFITNRPSPVEEYLTNPKRLNTFEYAEFMKEAYIRGKPSGGANVLDDVRSHLMRLLHLVDYLITDMPSAFQQLLEKDFMTPYQLKVTKDPSYKFDDDEIELLGLRYEPRLSSMK